MESANGTDTVNIDDESPIFTDDGSPTLVQAAEVPGDAKISPDKPGRRSHCNVVEEERYMQQRATPPKPSKQNVFK